MGALSIGGGPSGVPFGRWAHRDPRASVPIASHEVPLAGLIRFALFSTILIALLVFVALPLVSQSLVTSAVRDAGLQADEVDINVDLLGLGIFSGRAPSVHVVADDVTVPRALIGHLDLTLTDVSMADRTFASVNGTLDEVRVIGPQGLPFIIDRIDLDGPAENTRARGQLALSQAEAFIELVTRDAGIDVDQVTLADEHLVMEKDGRSTEADLRVDGDALILEQQGAEPVVLLAPAPSEHWSLQDVRVSADGLRIDIVVNARDIADGIAGQPD